MVKQAIVVFYAFCVSSFSSCGWQIPVPRSLRPVYWLLNHPIDCHTFVYLGFVHDYKNYMKRFIYYPDLEPPNTELLKFSILYLEKFAQAILEFVKKITCIAVNQYLRGKL